MLDVADVFVEFGVDGHVFGSDCEPLAMFVLVLDVEDKRDASWILSHHLLEETHSEMHTLYHQRLVSLVEVINHLGELLLNQGALLLISFESDPVLRGVLPLLERDLLSSLVGGAEEHGVLALFEEVAHHMSDGVRGEHS